MTKQLKESTAFQAIQNKALKSPAVMTKEETMKVKFQKWLCFWFGHRMYSMYEIDNGQSKFGEHKCSRCGYKDSWQYDY